MHVLKTHPHPRTHSYPPEQPLKPPISDGHTHPASPGTVSSELQRKSSICSKGQLSWDSMCSFPIPRSFNHLWANSRSDVFSSTIPKNWHLPRGNSTTGNLPQPLRRELSSSYFYTFNVSETLWSKATHWRTMQYPAETFQGRQHRVGIEALEGLLKMPVTWLW